MANIRFTEGSCGAAREAEDDCAEAPTSTNETKIPSAEEIAQNAKMWSVSGQAYFPSDYTVKGLPPGYYVVEHCNRGYYFYKTPMNLEDLIVLPD